MLKSSEVTQLGENDEKQQQRVSIQADSGFISGSNLMSSELSINSEGENINDQPEVALEPEKVADSVSEYNLSNLSLKSQSPSCLNIEQDQDFDKVTSFEHQNKLWRTYYTQDEDGDT